MSIGRVGMVLLETYLQNLFGIDTIKLSLKSFAVQYMPMASLFC
jgi:hypothetical protein